MSILCVSLYLSGTPVYLSPHGPCSSSSLLDLCEQCTPPTTFSASLHPLSHQARPLAYVQPLDPKQPSQCYLVCLCSELTKDVEAVVAQIVEAFKVGTAGKMSLDSVNKLWKAKQSEVEAVIHDAINQIDMIKNK